MEGGFEVDFELVFQLVLRDFAGCDMAREGVVTGVRGAVFREPAVCAGIAGDPD